MSSYLIGIDVGTSSAKAILIDETGRVVFATAPEYPFQTPRPQWAECDPEDWWKATVKALRAIAQQVEPKEIAGIGLTGQMHGLVLLDKEGKVLRPCIMWNDQRTARQCEALTGAVGADKVLQLTGNPVLPGFTAPKVLWVKENEPDVYRRAAKILLPKDYIRYRLSGEFFTEVSDASGTSLLNVEKRTWSGEMLAAAEIPREWMPEVTESPVASTRLSGEAASLTGLPEGLPIVAGGGDQAAGAVGCGIVKEGVVSCTLGTSGVVFAHSEEYRVEPEGRLHAFCHAVPGKWHLMGVQLSSAGSYQWYRRALGAGDSFRTLDEEANRVPAGSEGVLFLPYLTGERMPYADPEATGAFIGLTLRHRRAHMTRAVLEGVTYGLRDGLELMRNLGIAPKEIVASGGGAKSPLWLQILADVFRTRIITVNATEGAAFGAALLAGVGAGLYPSVEEACNRTIAESVRIEEGPDAQAYEAFYPHFRALYPALRSSYQALAKTIEERS